MLSVNRYGVKGFHKDLTWVWPWRRDTYLNWYDPDTNSAYLSLEHVDRLAVLAASKATPVSVPSKDTRKVVGFSEIDLLSDFARDSLYPSTYVILSRICIDIDALSFWMRVPAVERRELLNDFAILRCKTLKQVEDLTSSIPTRFANAYGFSDGEMVATNTGEEL